MLPQLMPNHKFRIRLQNSAELKKLKEMKFNPEMDINDKKQKICMFAFLSAKGQCACQHVNLDVYNAKVIWEKEMEPILISWHIVEQ